MAPQRRMLSLCLALACTFPCATRPASAAPAGSGYVDQLIDPDTADQLYADELRDEAAVPQGRRFFSIEYQHYRERRQPGDLTENGLQLNWRRETLNYGEFQLEASARKGDSDRQFSDVSGDGRFTLNQFGFAIDENRVMDNTLGVLRSASDPMLTSSFRQNLTSTLLAGGQTRVMHGGFSTLYASAGRIGRLDTGQVQGFDFEDGEQYGLGYWVEVDVKGRKAVPKLGSDSEVLPGDVNERLIIEA